MEKEQLERAVSGENGGELRLSSAPGEGTNASLIFRRIGGLYYAEV